MPLLGFPNLPPSDELCLCQVDGRLYSMPVHCANIATFTKTIEHHPKIVITRDMLHGATNRDEIGRNVFLPVRETVLKRLVHVWYEHGFVEALHAAARPEHAQPAVITTTAKFLVKMLDSFSHMKRYITPNLHGSGIDLIATLSTTRYWHNSPIRCIAWHPHFTKLAVATLDDTVRIYTAETKLVPVLKLRRQKNIACMAWRPMSSSELAVGCECGIIVWTVDPNSVVARPSSNNAQVLQVQGHTPIVSLTWSPFGDLLASGAVHDNSVRVWDVDTGRSDAIRRSIGGGVCLIRWSPDGSKLFSSSSANVFRIWSTVTWTAERWDVGAGRVQAACFSPCGRIVLFCTDSEPTVFALSANAQGVWASKNDNSTNAAVPVLNMPRSEEPADIEGGLIQDLSWDPNGNHLAVLFKEGPIVAIFNTIMGPVVQITPCCLLNGLEYEKPSGIMFQKNFQHGSCLTVAWSSGRIQHFPLVTSLAL